ncbi:hypothetical protein [Streptomyces sp. NPDC049881]|uniref:hypothetical protein n=1 Tax=Streptomyces sp. NPDC049881 TaxID=3155778 RepID=UPI003446764C
MQQDEGRAPSFTIVVTPELPAEVQLTAGRRQGGDVILLAAEGEISPELARQLGTMLTYLWRYGLGDDPEQ